MKRILRTCRLIAAALKEQVRAEKAFLGNFWFGMIGRIIYNIMFLLFIDVLFKRVGNIAGYSQNDFLFMYFMAQFGFYITYACIFQAAQRLLLTVRTGNLDLLLLKPVPHRSFLYVQGLQPVDLFFTLVTTLPLVASQINWATLDIAAGPALLGAIIWICGIIICNTFVFALVLPAFKTGDATDTLSVFYSITALGSVPYGKLPIFMKILSLGVLPHLLLSGAAVEVMLQKGDTLAIILPVLAATVFSLGIYQFMWRYALRNYTSASS
jgi:ABC-type uncharacterized transport system permease subunit